MTTVAIIGNPNVGKTELFNRLTGMKQHVGNWPGVTVEKKTGKLVHRGEEIEVVDLPGTYSLATTAKDELISRNYILEERPDVVVDIVDATSLERNLYLTLLLLELETNLVVALNRWDMARERGIVIETEKLSELLGVPVVPTVAPTGEGVERLKEAMLEAAKGEMRKIVIGYGEDAEIAIGEVEDAVRKDAGLSGRYPPRWLAIKLLEKDEHVLKLIETSPHQREISAAVK
ncbi:MAG TPA: FeoB small GTPase domain-containing protein [Methanothrix sp.]|jgi:ferrous iron transport protein B|nr:FeoB small GTPase domain-containing protein [Methanothrix sp.]HOI69113.1 FeoB small GTPase domain-containing protein [Methanothrix sp.]